MRSWHICTATTSVVSSVANETSHWLTSSNLLTRSASDLLFCWKLCTEQAGGASSSFLSLQFGQDLHVALKAWRTAGEVLADFVVPFWNGMIRHPLQGGIRRTIDTLRIGEGFGEIRLREAEEFFLVKFLLFVF